MTIRDAEALVKIWRLRDVLIETHASWMRKPSSKKRRRFLQTTNQIEAIEKAMKTRAANQAEEEFRLKEAQMRRDITSVIRDQARKRAAPWEGRGNRD